MYLAPFDTLMYFKKLREGDFTAEQAETLVSILKEIMTNNSASKSDNFSNADTVATQYDIRKLEYKLTTRLLVVLALAAVVILITILK